MDILLLALGSATQVWRTALHQVGWHHAGMALAYLGVAWLCTVRGSALKLAHQPHAAWHFTGIALCLLGANTLLQADLWATDFIRSLAKLQGWYGMRRGLQYALLPVLAGLALPGVRFLHRAFAQGDLACLAVQMGLTVVMLVLALRVVSAHGTDALLHWRLFAVSVARWLELAGVVLVAWGCAGRQVHNAATIFWREISSIGTHET